MALALTITSQSFDASTVTVFFNVTASGSYVANGDILSFLSAAIIVSSPPLRVYIQEQPPAGTSVSGYSYSWAPGTTLANGKVQVLKGNGAAPQTDLGAGAYPAGVTGAVIVGEAVFNRL